jgi:hypothetical protein
MVLNEISSDTIFLLTKDNNRIAKAIRTPSVNSKDNKTILASDILTNNFHLLTSEVLGTPDSEKSYLIDLKTEKINEVRFYNNKDFTSNKMLLIGGRTIMPGIISKKFYAYELLDFYKKGELKGNLKEIAKTVNENDNPIIMLIKLK